MSTFTRKQAGHPKCTHLLWKRDSKYTVNNPANKCRTKVNIGRLTLDIQYKLELEDDLVDQSYCQMEEQDRNMTLKKRVLIINV